MAVRELPPPSPSQFAGLVEQMKRELTVQLEYEAMRAKIARVRYNALVDQGFTRTEALELCKANY
jgi:hypothetical protein